MEFFFSFEKKKILSPSPALFRMVIEMQKRIMRMRETYFFFGKRHLIKNLGTDGGIGYQIYGESAMFDEWIGYRI